MTHQQFKERLEEIQVKNHKLGCDYNCTKEEILQDSKVATESLITLFEDYTNSIVEYLPKEVKAEMPNITTYAYNRAIKDVRQTINQTSKTILRGSE